MNKSALEFRDIKSLLGKKKQAKYLSSMPFLSLLTLTACGGGSNTSDTSGDSAPATTAYSGSVIKGPLQNALVFLDSLSVPADGVQVINDLCNLFFPKDIDQAKKDILLDILTNGLPLFEWTIEYGEYQLNPGDPNYADPIRTRIELVLKELFMFPEFQTV